MDSIIDWFRTRGYRDLSTHLLYAVGAHVVATPT